MSKQIHSEGSHQLAVAINGKNMEKKQQEKKGGMMCFCHERESKNLETAIQNGGLKTAHRSARIYCFLSEILSLMKLFYFHTQVVRTIELQEIFTRSIWPSQALWQVFFAFPLLWSKYYMVDGGILDFLLANWYQQFKASIE